MKFIESPKCFVLLINDDCLGHGLISLTFLLLEAAGVLLT